MQKWARRSWYSLRGRLILCVTVALLGMGFTVSQAFYNAWENARTQVLEEFSDMGGRMQDTLSQTFDEYENVARLVGYATSVQAYMLSEEPVEVIKSFPAALNYLENIYPLSHSCTNIFLYARNGRYLYANTNQVKDIHTMVEEQGLMEGAPLGSATFFLLEDGAGERQVFYVLPVYDARRAGAFGRSSQMLAALLCDMDQVAGRVTAASRESPDAAALLYQGKVVSSTRPLGEAEEEMLAQVPENENSLRRGADTYLTTRISLPERDWAFIYFIPEKEIFSRAFRSMNPVMLLMVGVICLLSLLLMLLVRSINKSVQQITSDININSSAAMTEYVHIREPRLEELRTIARSVNHMLARLQEAFMQEQQAQKRMYQAIHAQNQAEMMGYRSQINPHFLFNTLECMRSMAHSRGESSLEALVSSLALTFRYSLYAGTMVTLAQELSHIKSYFEVIRIRFRGRYRLQVSAQPEIREHQMLSMVLQPIVENSVNHAFVEKETDCRVSIQAYRGEQGRLVVRIADNGAGLDEGELAALKERMCRGVGEPQGGRSSIGLHNIYHRMKLTFGSHFHIRFRSKKGFFTVVELVIPQEPMVLPFEKGPQDYDG
ncbi:cache domain-containing sensor histidine kinase [Acutalibacter caecimuris]|uniref:cache domain-containing sensor histidine kinase n=1 Tax=Acutalibacter caecimuris TaxID=3093657 RepID=UPI002AC90E68|nr:sensor histidine kinase [Acutalibacter sp. M00118]